MASLTRTVAGFDEPAAVAVAGDWHGNLHWAQYVLASPSVAGQCDAIVHTGDFGLWPGERGERYLDGIEEMLANRGLPLYWVDGNHEDHETLTHWPLSGGVHVIRPHIIHLPRGFRWHWQGQTWLALGGAASIDRDHRVEGRSWWPGEAITDADVELATSGGEVDILVCHDAPAGVDALDLWLTRNGIDLTKQVREYSDHSRRQVRRVVDATRPHRLFHGHYHVRYDGVLAGDGYRTMISGLDCDGTNLWKNTIRQELPINFDASPGG